MLKCGPTYCQLSRKVVGRCHDTRDAEQHIQFLRTIALGHLRVVERVAVDFDRYDDVAINSLRLSLEAIRQQTDSFACWQHRGRLGRPAYEERTLLVAFLVQQLLGLIFPRDRGRAGDGPLVLSPGTNSGPFDAFEEAVVEALDRGAGTVLPAHRRRAAATQRGGGHGRHRLFGTEARMERDEARAACSGGLGQGARGDRGGRVLGPQLRAHSLERARQPDVRGHLGPTTVERFCRSVLWPTPLTSATTAWPPPGSMERRRSMRSRRTRGTSSGRRTSIKSW